MFDRSYVAGIENGESSSKSSAFSVVRSHHKNISKVVLSCNGRLPAHILFTLFDDMSFILSFLFFSRRFVQAAQVSSEVFVPGLSFIVSQMCKS